MSDSDRTSCCAVLYFVVRAVELGFKKPKNPNLGFLGFLILLFCFYSF